MFLSKRRIECLISIVAALSLLARVDIALSQEDLRVLPTQGEDGPTQDMVSRFLSKQLDEAFQRRQAAYENIKTPEQAAEYQIRMRAAFIEHLGGFPKRTPLNAKTIGTINGDGYRIEKVVYESQPNHYVTAVLFLPATKPPFPGVVIPCGHSSTGKAAQQRMCILLAKNGIAALSYDPIGQGERSQFLDSDGKQHFKATSEHNLIGQGSAPLGRNTATFRIWDGMRSIDYLSSRSEIDANKIGVTGCSGGGTLTSYLMALDDRVACAAPSCYITSFRRLIDTIGPQDAEQNIHGQLAFGMDHADYLMMRAPKPTLLLASTRDFFDIKGTWDSFRQAKRYYTRLGFGERIGLVETDAKHGFPKLQREAMVRWMRRFLLEIDEPILEPEFATHSVSDLQCTPDGQVLLLEGARSVVDLNVEFNKKLESQRADLWKPENRSQALAKARQIAGVREWNVLPQPKIRRHGNIQRKNYHIEKLTIESEAGVQLPALLFAPQTPNGRKYLYLNGEGKHADAAPEGKIEQLVNNGSVVLAVDLRGIGETKTTGRDVTIAYLLGKSLVGMRAEDVLIATRVLSEWEEKDEPSEVHLIASGVVEAAAIHAAAFESNRFASLELNGDTPSWSSVVRDPSKGRMSNIVHGALTIYDLPDLVTSYRTSRKQDSTP